MKKQISLLVAMMVLQSMSTALYAQSSVPAVFGYHSTLFDEGGNVIPDGEVTLHFQVMDEKSQVLYEEEQSVIARSGKVSALIGNGTTLDGIPTGGLPIEQVAQEDRLFLKVMVEGVEPLPPLELASVPYAMVAQEAKGVSAGSIGFEELGSDVVDELRGGLEDQDRFPFRRIAWGTVVVDWNGSNYSGENFSVKSSGISSCEIAFLKPLASSSYAVVVTPSGSSGSLYVTNKTINGFQISGFPTAFDFIVMGR